MEDWLSSEACTMPTAERPLRLAEFDALFATAVRSVERRGHDVRMHLAGGKGLVGQVRDLTARETSCCSFFTFTVAGTDRNLTLDVSVPPAHQRLLDALTERAEELSATATTCAPRSTPAATTSTDAPPATAAHSPSSR